MSAGELDGVKEHLAVILLTFDKSKAPEGLVNYCAVAAVRDGLAVRREGMHTLAIAFPSEARLRAEAERAGLLRFARPTGAWEEYVADAHASFAPAAGAPAHSVFSAAERLHLLEGAISHVPATPLDDAEADAREKLRALLGPHADSLHPDEPLFQMLRRFELISDQLRPHPHNSREALWAAHGSSVRALLSESTLDSICACFGSEVAIYFAWLAHTLRWYAPVGAIGVCVWGYHWRCGVSVDESTAAPIFSAMLVLWAAAQHRCWRRAAACHALRWGTFEEGSLAGGYGGDVRAGFRGRKAISPVTGLPELSFSRWERLPRYCVSILATCALLCVSAIVVVCSLNVQGHIDEGDGSLAYVSRLRALSRPGGPFDLEGRSTLRAWTPCVLHFTMMRILNAIYSGLAEWLTEFENHRTVREHEGALLLKRFAFEAFDAYALLLYLAFAKRDVGALREELIGVYSTDGVRRVLSEAVLPWVCLQVERSAASWMAGWEWSALWRARPSPQEEEERWKAARAVEAEAVAAKAVGAPGARVARRGARGHAKAAIAAALALRAAGSANEQLDEEGEAAKKLAAVFEEESMLDDCARRCCCC